MKSKKIDQVLGYDVAVDVRPLSPQDIQFIIHISNDKMVTSVRVEIHDSLDSLDAFEDVIRDIRWQLFR